MCRYKHSLFTKVNLNPRTRMALVEAEICRFLLHINGGVDRIPFATRRNFDLPTGKRIGILPLSPECANPRKNTVVVIRLITRQLELKSWTEVRWSSDSHWG